MTARMLSKKSKRPKKKMKRRTKFTIFAIFNIVWYTLLVLWLSCNDHVVPSELTIGWYSAWTIELALLFGIKVRSKDASDDGGDEYTTIEAEDAAIDEYNNEIDRQSEDNTPDYDDRVG